MPESQFQDQLSSERDPFLDFKVVKIYSKAKILAQVVVSDLVGAEFFSH